MTATVDELLSSDEPSVRWKVRLAVLHEDPDSGGIRRLREEIRTSARVRALLDSQAGRQPHTYAKWQGAHWVLAALTDLGYPQGDEALRPLVDTVLSHWLAPQYFTEFTTTGAGYGRAGVPVIDGRARRCGSQQGNALRSVMGLGLEDDRAGALVERLVHWQWPDGGWNCDRKRNAASSSVHETLLPMRGLHLYATRYDDTGARDAALKAADVLMQRRLLFRRSNGELGHADWARLHHPVYWHYDVLAGLLGLAELGLLRDQRCSDALDLLERKRLPHGGWPAEGRYYRGPGVAGANVEVVDWGPVSKNRANAWVTAHALSVLVAAGRDV